MELSVGINRSSERRSERNHLGAHDHDEDRRREVLSPTHQRHHLFPLGAVEVSLELSLGAVGGRYTKGSSENNSDRAA